MAKYRKKPVVIEALQWNGCWKDMNKFLRKPTVGPGQTLIIHTLEGDMHANIGDWVIKGVNGEYYPYKPDIFEKTYELVETD